MRNLFLSKGIQSRHVSDIQYGSLVPIIEILSSLVIIVSATVYLSLFIGVKSTTSLENDEIYSITHFSSQGALTTLSDYHVPNNHIFFNLLNALTPEMQSYVPLRARMWSFVAIGAGLSLALVEFFLRRQFFAGAVFFQVVTVNFYLMDLVLKARGYGIVAFCALATCLSLLRYLREAKIHWLIIISVLTVAGTWTIPLYVFFSGALLALLFIWKRKRTVLIVGLITILAIIGVYLPVIRQLIENQRTYAHEWGRQFDTMNAVYDTIKVFLLHPTVFGMDFQDKEILAFLFGLVVIPYVIWDHKDASGQGVRLIIFAVFFLLGSSLFLGTPPIRAVAFVVLPITLCFVFIIDKLLYGPYLRPVRSLIYSGVGILFLLHNIHQIEYFHFVPFENWMGTADYIEQTYPEGTEVFVNFQPSNLSVYLDPMFPITDNFDVEKFAAGQTIFVDSDWLAEERAIIQDPSSYSPEAMVFQIAGGYQKIIAKPLPGPWIDRVIVDGIESSQEALYWDMTAPLVINPSQSILEKDVRIQIILDSKKPYRSLNLAVPGLSPVLTVKDLPLDLEICLVNGGMTERLDDKAISIHKNLITIALSDRAVEQVNLIISSINSDREYPIVVNKIWVYPLSKY